MKLSFKTLIPGITSASFILILLGTALSSLWIYAFQAGNLTLYFDNYLWHVIWITAFQAGLSTLLSIMCAILMAKALVMVNFVGKSLLVRLMPITFILPALVVVGGLLSVYGQQGIIATICNWAGLPFSVSIYGLTGILLAHLFLNFPYACHLFYQTMMSVPIEQKQLAAQLNFSTITFFKIAEWPLLRRQILPMSALIFMLCFSSFAIVLALGGGPKYTTIEVAIYQSIRDFDFLQAVLLSSLQLFFGIGLMWLVKQISQVQRITTQFIHYNYTMPKSCFVYSLSVLIIIIGVLFIFTPIVTIILQGLYYFKLSLFTTTLKHAFYYSVLIALSSALITMLLAGLLLWTSNQLRIYHALKWSDFLMLIGSLILAIPSMVLAAGLFLLWFNFADNAQFVCLLVIVCNSLMALPFVLKNLETPLYDINNRYLNLSQSLNITGFKHFYLIEYKALKRLIMTSFTFAAILSLGDFGIIALFGGQAIITLPYYLYEQLSYYHYQDSAVTTFILLLLSIFLLMVINHDRT